MKINRHISFLKQENLELFEYLNTHSIPYKEVLQSCVLDIYENSPHWKTVSTLIQRSKALCLSNTVYTRDELGAARWLTLRSLWRCGYPQPEDGVGYEAITYSIQNYCATCGTGLEQSAEFRIKKTPKWGKRHFMMLNWVGDEIFVDDTAKTLLIQSGLTGFSFRNVYDKKGTEVLTDISQISIQSVLPDGLLTNTRAVDQINRCPDCGVIKYHSTGIGSHAFRREIFENAPDIVKTKEIFGWEHWTQREIIVSQRFYQFVINNHLEGALEFEPVDLL